MSDKPVLVILAAGMDSRYGRMKQLDPVGNHGQLIIDYSYTEDGGQTWGELPGDTVVSMILWGFTRSFMDEAWARFPAFLDKTLKENPLKGEYFLPDVVSELIEAGRARMKVLRSEDKWYGVTYREDKPTVVAAIAEKTKAGLYPDRLWEV